MGPIGVAGGTETLLPMRLGYQLEFFELNLGRSYVGAIPRAYQHCMGFIEVSWEPNRHWQPISVAIFGISPANPLPHNLQYVVCASSY